MKLPFRQGIVKYSLDNNKLPTFLYADRRDNYVTLLVTSSKVLLAFAHYDADYLFEEGQTVNNAWGPFEKSSNPAAPGPKYWMYWDLDVKTAGRSFGITKKAPIISRTAPEVIVAIDGNVDTYGDIGQTWFDLTNTRTVEWDGAHWVTKIRLFSGTYQDGYVEPYPSSTQVSIYQECDAGFIVFDDYDTPAAQARSDGTYKFLTTTSKFHESKNLTTTVSLQSTVYSGYASEDIPQYTMVSFQAENKLKIAASDDTLLCPGIGITGQDILQGQKCTIYTNDYVINPNWHWIQSGAQPSDPVYLSTEGNISLDPPLQGFIQKIGFVVNDTTLFIDTTYQIVYQDSYLYTNTIPVSVDVTTGKLYTSLIQDDQQSVNITYKIYGNKHIQPIANKTWIIVHNSYLQNFLVQPYDEFGNAVIPENVLRIPHIKKTGQTTIAVTFTRKIKGTAQLFLF